MRANDCVCFVRHTTHKFRKHTEKQTNKRVNLPASRLDLEAKLPLCDRRACACLTPPSRTQ